MSKDRQTVKEKKKPANPLGKKAPSDYQSGKASKSDSTVIPKKK
ncbi:MAG: hypothetical protein ABI203_02665 [Mucilaginibacter sp.]